MLSAELNNYIQSTVILLLRNNNNNWWFIVRLLNYLFLSCIPCHSFLFLISSCPGNKSLRPLQHLSLQPLLLCCLEVSSQLLLTIILHFSAFMHSPTLLEAASVFGRLVNIWKSKISASPWKSGFMSHLSSQPCSMVQNHGHYLSQKWKN